MDCGYGNIYGSNCMMSCYTGQCLVGDDTVTCENIGNSTHPKVQWTWTGEEPFCKGGISFSLSYNRDIILYLILYSLYSPDRSIRE